jgi:uncharacterized protein
MLNRTSKNIIIAGIVLIIILFAAKLLFFPRDISQKTITSTGTAEIIANPDLAEIYATIEVLKDTAQEAEASSKEISDAVLEKAKSFDDLKVETLSYNIYKREDWTEKGSVFKGYTASYSLKLSTEDFKDIGEVIDSIVNAGVNRIDNIQFTISLDNEETIKARALKKATESARVKAEAIAEGLNVRLGKIVSVSESGFYPRPYMMEKAVADIEQGREASSLIFEPRDITVTATINVVYSIN